MSHANSGWPSPPSNPMEAAVREALEAFAAPELRDEILKRALVVAGLDAVPGGGPELREFVDRFLRQSMEVSLGAHSADAAAVELSSIVSVAERTSEISQVRDALMEDEDFWDSPLDLPPTVGDQSDWSSLDPSVALESSAALSPPFVQPDFVDLEAFVAAPEANRESHAPSPQQVAAEAKAASPISPRQDTGTDFRQAHFAPRELAPPPGVSSSAARPDPEALARALEHSAETRPAVAGWMSGNQRQALSARGDLEPLAVLLSTADDSLAQAFTRELAVVQVIRVQGPIELLELLQDHPSRPPPSVLVFDCLHPAIQSATLAALAGDLPTSATLVFWRPTDEARRDLGDMEYLRSRSDPTASELPLDKLVSRCRALAFNR